MNATSEGPSGAAVPERTIDGFAVRIVDLDDGMMTGDPGRVALLAQALDGAPEVALAQTIGSPHTRLAG